MYLLAFVAFVWVVDFIGRVQTVLTLPELVPHALRFLNSPNILGTSILIAACLIGGAIIYSESGRRQRAADAGPVPPFDLREALHYLYDHSKWGRQITASRPDDSMFTVAKAMHHAAKAGALVIWGRKVGSIQFEPITPGFWETSGFDLTRLFTDGSENVMVQTGMLARGFGLFMGRSATVYEDLRVDHDNVKQLWPPRWSYLWQEIARQFLPKTKRDRSARLPLLA